jgi:hypothetical protein
MLGPPERRRGYIFFRFGPQLAEANGLHFDDIRRALEGLCSTLPHSHSPRKSTIVSLAGVLLQEARLRSVAYFPT